MFARHHPQKHLMSSVVSVLWTAVHTFTVSSVGSLLPSKDPSGYIYIHTYIAIELYGCLKISPVSILCFPETMIKKTNNQTKKSTNQPLPPKENINLGSLLFSKKSLLYFTYIISWIHLTLTSKMLYQVEWHCAMWLDTMLHDVVCCLETNLQISFKQIGICIVQSEV